jgi:nucleoside-diphosphate-sugar epimerase
MNKTIKNKFLITGATGFIGSFLVNELIKKEKDITVLVRNTSDKKVINEFIKKKIKVVVGDLRLKDSLYSAIKDRNIVIHCAAIHDYRPKDLKATNINGTKNLVEVCVKKNIKRFIYMSSATVFGSVKNGNEKSKPSPESYYAKSKLCGEKIVKKEMDYTIISPPIVYGPHKRASLIKWSKYIKKGYFIIFGKGYNNVELIHVSDVVNAVISSIYTKKSIKQTYVISTDTISMNKITNIISKELNVHKPIKIPISLGYSIAFFLTFVYKIIKKKSPLTITNVINMKRDRNFICDKAKKELGFEPKIKIKEGISQLIEWGKEKKYLAND